MQDTCSGHAVLQCHADVFQKLPGQHFGIERYSDDIADFRFQYTASMSHIGNDNINVGSLLC